MRRDKRRWLYAGLGIRSGVAAVRTSKGVLGPLQLQRVLLLGGSVARGISPALGRMAADAKVGLRVYLFRSASSDSKSLDLGWLSGELDKYRPTVLVMAMERQEPRGSEIDGLARGRGVAVLWLLGRSPQLAAASKTLLLAGNGGTMPFTASGYAAWAADVWRAIG